MSPAGGSKARRRGLAVIAGVLGLCLVAAVVATLANARSSAIALVSHRIGRPVHVDGELSFHPSPGGLTVRFSRLRVDQASSAGPGAMVWVDEGLVSLPWTALLGDVRLRDVELDGLRLDLKRDAAGRANWTDGSTTKGSSPPRIGRISIRNGTLDFQDLSRSITFNGSVTVGTNAAGAPVLTLGGKGRSEDGVWSATLHSTADFAGSRPYALKGGLILDRPSGHSTAEFDGQFSPAAGGRLQGRLQAAGPDLHDLSHLSNTPLPRTPRYRLSTRLDRTAQRVLLEALAGRIGSSDVAGSLTITPDPAGQRLDGALRSRSLRMSDLFAVASGGQLTRAHRSGRLLPDAAINAAPLRKLVGELHFSADSVQAPTTPTIRSLQTRITFDRGRVAADPLVLDLARGRAILHFVLDGRGSVPHVRFDADIQHADTADFMKTKAARAPLQAAFVGDIQLQGAGASLAEAAGHASGSLRMRALNGRLPQTQAAVLSADFVHGVASLLSKTPRDIAMRCAVASFQVVDGEARATSLKMSTDLGGVTGYGGFNLRTGTVDMTLRPAVPRVTDVTSVRIDGLLVHPHATLALDNPTGIVRHAVTGLLHPLRAVRPVESGCE